MALDLLGALLVALPSAFIAWRLRAVTGGGALAGAVCAVAIYLGAYLAGIAVLGTALIVAVLATRAGARRKAALGIAEDGCAPRGVASVLANCGVGALAAVLTAFTNVLAGETGAIVIVTAIAAGASDTAASEIGKAAGARPRTFPTFRAVAPGTPGAVSAIGTIAGLAAAATIVWPAVSFWLLAPDRVLVIVLACGLGGALESTLATLLESRGSIGNHTLNVLNTATAAAIAGGWVSL